jgi:ribokinase
MTHKVGTIAPAAVQLVAAGDANVELVLPKLRNLPRFGQEVVVPEMGFRAAGSAANFALCAASLGASTGFAGRLAIDQFGEVVVRAFREVGVKTQWSHFVENQSTGISVAFVRDDGERSFVTFKGTNSQVTLNDLQSCMEADLPPRWFHLAGYHLLDLIRGVNAKALLKKAHKQGIITSLDTGWDPAGWTTKTVTEIHNILPFVDVFFPNEKEVYALTGLRNPRKGALRLLEIGALNVVVKMGAKGCLLITKEDQRRIPAFEVEVLDTTAAGDAFDAGFAVSMLSGATLARSAVYAAAVAALRVSRKPAQSLFPSLQETAAFLIRRRPLDM